MRTPLILIGVVAVVAAVVVAVSGVSPGAAPTPSGAAGAPSGSPAGVASSPGAASPGGPPALLWPAPPDPLERTVAAGLGPAPQEYGFNHVHAHLDVFVDGQEIVVPAGIGINIKDPEVKYFDDDAAHMAASRCAASRASRHSTRMTRRESSTPNPGKRSPIPSASSSPSGGSSSARPASRTMRTTPIAVYVGGELSKGDPRAIELTDQKVIVVVVGTPPAVIPSTADFSQA